jgi:DNA polymerase-3 subunit alpha
MFQQASFFDMPAFATTGIQVNLPDVPEVPRKEALAWEKELIGAYISEHPLSRVWADLENTITVLAGQIDDTMAEQNVTVAGMVNYVRQIVTKRGEPMAFSQIEDLQGTVEVVIFPRLWEETRDLWEPEHILVVRGRVSVRGREPSILAESVTNEILTVHTREDRSLPAASSSDARPVHIHVTVARNHDMEHTIQRLGQVYDLLRSYPGEDRFSLYVENGGHNRIQIEFPNDATGHCLELEQKLREMVGAGAVQVEPISPGTE